MLPANKTKSGIHLILSFDDYHPENIRLAKALAELKLTAVFFIETITPGAEEQIKELSRLGMDIGSHTMSHPADLKALPLEEVRSELEISKRQIEEWTGKPCTALAYPRGRFNDAVVEVVKNVGYTDARTTHVLRTEAEDPLRAPTTAHVYNGRKEYGGRDWQTIARFHWAYLKKRQHGFFHLWGHMGEILRFSEYTNLIRFLKETIA